MVKPPPPIRVLFVMHYPGYLRYFDGVLQGLAERGHAIDLAFGSMTRQSEGLVAMDRIGEAASVVGVPPVRRGRIAAAADAIGRTADDLRYLHPRYSNSTALRLRRRPPAIKSLRRVQGLRPLMVDSLVPVLLKIDRAIPSGRDIEAFIARSRPDVVVVSPLVLDAKHQAEIVRSAQALGIPVMLAVGSWDHLSTKRLIRPLPDLILVWNEIQRREAIEIHYVPPERTLVTGAQPFDRWFGRAPSTSREAFLRNAGLPVDRQVVTFVGSTATVCDPEAERRFVIDWITALRSSGDATVRRASILVRPHPYNVHWERDDMPALPGVVLWPPNRPNPVDAADRDDYFDSLFHSDAVVGINTSAMVEAAVIGGPVLSVTAPEFRRGQMETPHFRYLLPENGGFLMVAPALGTHLAHLADVMSNPDEHRARRDGFLDSFIRPNGPDRTATSLVVEAVERMAGGSFDLPSPGSGLRRGPR